MRLLFAPVCLAVIFIYMHTTTTDGPYVQYGNGQVYVYHILDNHGKAEFRKDSFALSQRDSLKLQVATDVPGESFQVSLKPSIQKEKSDFKKAGRQFAVSDIEGNFASFRKLLVAAGVMDNQFNWTFGDGHLVLTGDFVDRGEKVTEVLWLIYALEEKAKQAGGYVHYILGNHEIMNLSGDLRYVHPKYLSTATALQIPFVNLYGPDTELGRWLRSKNVIERVGDFLYTHGGISADINNLELSIHKINELSQPFYADSSFQYPDPGIAVIFNDNGPFWYRGYYSGNGVAADQIDNTIRRYNVRHIVTGHTLLRDTVSSWYNGKVFNTDVHHAGGKSEGLLIEENEIYRINAAGEKFLLMRKKR